MQLFNFMNNRRYTNIWCYIDEYYNTKHNDHTEEKEKISCLLKN